MPTLQNLIQPVLTAALKTASRLRCPKADGKIGLHGPHNPVEIYRDAWGIPHIYAITFSDALFAQGFVHAQDRLWQMDLNRRIAAGRLAEVLGEPALTADRWMRTMGLRRVAEQEVSLLGVDPRAWLEAYAAGVNAAMAAGKLPIEFSLLKYRPEPWTVADTLSWIKIMAWDLCADWHGTLERARLAATVPPDLLAELNSTPERIGATLTVHAQPSPDWPAAPGDSGLGSNNWVIGGSRTATGKPLLANDMHLGMGIPSIWYENHLCADGINMTGITFPGIPGVVSGHNGYVAWGYTDGLPDVQDLYIEHIQHSDDGEVLAEYKGEWYPVQVLPERIHVKGVEDHIEQVWITRHGPIITPLLENVKDPLAMRWTALEPDTMITSLLELTRARTCHDVREALRHWTAPVQNVVYADADGNIGYSFPGKIPIRRTGDGSVPVPGWVDDYEWTGYIPYDELPHLYNPARGYVATANSRVAGDDYPYYLGEPFLHGFRCERITEMIEAKEKIDIAYIQKMHLDQLSPLARDTVEFFRSIEVADPDLKTVVAILRGWDGVCSADSQAAAIYEVFIAQATTTLFRNLGIRALSGDTYRDHCLNLLKKPDSIWFTKHLGMPRDQVVEQSLKATIQWLQTELGAMERWHWGALHQITHRHTLGEVAQLAPLLNRGPYPLGGDGTTVCAAYEGELKAGVRSAAPYRMIVDLGDVRNSVGLLTPGQSGHPGSPHYDDQIQAWRQGMYHPMWFTREDVERHKRHRLVIQPAD